MKKELHSINTINDILNENKNIRLQINNNVRTEKSALNNLNHFILASTILFKKVLKFICN